MRRTFGMSTTCRSNTLETIHFEYLTHETNQTKYQNKVNKKDKETATKIGCVQFWCSKFCKHIWSLYSDVSCSRYRFSVQITFNSLSSSSSHIHWRDLLLIQFGRTLSLSIQHFIYFFSTHLFYSQFIAIQCECMR